ncbi:MAG: hypothetical protein GOV15_02205 [Candidatus Diapherotrites archaeon]|nr:hypothetical protein [Candidatus Diapherotrites archaeon]
MAEQISLRLQPDLLKTAKKYVKTHGYKNVQELATQSLREKVFEEEKEELSKKELELIEDLLISSLKTGAIRTRDDLMKALG